MYQKIAVMIVTALFSMTCQAFERTFPDSAKRATLSSISTHPHILLDKKKHTLSVSARIWNERNMITMPARIKGAHFIVNYTENMQGEIDRVWILSVKEVKKPNPADLPERRK